MINAVSQMTALNFIVQKAFSKLRSDGNCSSHRRDWLEFSVFSLLGSKRLKATRGSHAPAVRHLSLHLFLCPPLVPIALSLSSPTHTFRYTHRPAWTLAIRLTVEEMRTRDEAGIDLRGDFSNLAALWFITRIVSTMKNALHRAKLN